MVSRQWRLAILSPHETEPQRLNQTLGEWAHLHGTTPPAAEPAPDAWWPGSRGFTVTVPDDPANPPLWLRSLYSYLWGTGYMARLFSPSGARNELALGELGRQP